MRDGYVVAWIVAEGAHHLGNPISNLTGGKRWRRMRFLYIILHIVPLRVHYK